MSDFITDKTAEMIAAADAGDDQALKAAFTEALSENDTSLAQTLAAMTAAATRLRGA
ncbi:hypothetical protein [Streptomyces galbus]|uniref:Uncharacterized protein n=1 Tax=Streptomyces galbus TaxID=33898 RepID=A0ABX1IRR2_STRGB|nr:hypothetical protein [Streptomyces galbus]NKQ28035.1 hypothetical protein [Streptomyces galbus]